MEHWEQGVQEDQKNKQTNKPTKQTNKKPPKKQNQNKTQITEAKTCQKQQTSKKKSYFMVLRKNNDYFSM